LFPLKDNIPTESFPLITVLLIAINVVAYLASIRHGGSFFGGPTDSTVFDYAAIPFAFTHPGDHCVLQSVHDVFGNLQQFSACAGRPRPAGQLPTWETAFSGMFLHASFLHIFGNMLFLAIFGPSVEDAMGHVRYAAFYLLGGLVALAAQIAVGAGSTAPTLGASGAIAAVLGGYILLYPRARILTVVFIIFFFTVIELPALVLLGFWFLEQVYFGAAGLTDPVGGGGVAYFAHVGGFIFGLVVVRLFATHRRALPPRRPVY
jgi:membrane associated rhomboid family serine protease